MNGLLKLLAPQWQLVYPAGQGWGQPVAATKHSAPGREPGRGILGLRVILEASLLTKMPQTPVNLTHVPPSIEHKLVNGNAGHLKETAGQSTSESSNIFNNEKHVSPLEPRNSTPRNVTEEK